MGKRTKSRTLRLSLTRIPIAGKTKKVKKMKGEKPAAAVDVEEMLQSSVIFTNDGSSRTRSGFKNGESVQRTPTRSRAGGSGRKGLEGSNSENVNAALKSPPTPVLTRTLRVRIKDLSPSKRIRNINPSVPLAEVNGMQNKIDEPASEKPVSSDEPVAPAEEQPKVDAEPEAAISVEKVTDSSALPPLSPSPKSPAADILDGLKSPQRATYLLKQLESTLSPKYMKPNKTTIGLPTSRYGRIQKQKENTDYIPLDVAKFITKSPAKFKSIKKELEIQQEQTPPEEAGLPSTELESIQMQPAESNVLSMEPKPEPVEASSSTEVELSDPPSTVEIVNEEIIPDSDSEVSQIIPIMDPNASLVGIDQIQIIDLDASFGESVSSATPCMPVSEEVEPCESSEKSPKHIDMDVSSEASSSNLAPSVAIPEEAEPSKSPEESPPATDVIPEIQQDIPEADIADVPAPEPNATIEDSEYHAGQMLWGAFNSKTPHWPCMISPDPVDGKIRRKVDKQTVYKLHVKFFADNGRRAWIPEHQVLPFSTVDQYKALVETQFKSLRHKLIAMIKRGIWEDAIRQAEDTQSLPIEAREARYQELLEEDRAKSVAARRRKSVSVGYHSNSFDESYESGRKRHRSRTPESPAYEALPLASKSNESLSKRIKLEPSDQDLFRSTISRYFQSMADGSDIADTASATSSECEDITEMLESDREVYNNFLNMSRLYVFEGQTETEVDKKLQKYVQKIAALRMHSMANGARLSSRLRSQAMRKLGRELGFDKTKEASSPSSSAAAEPKVRKKVAPKTLEEQFIFDLEKNYLVKSVPRGFVCTICTKPNDLVKCCKCCNFYHLACLTDVPVKPDPTGESKTFTCSDCILQKPPACFVCQDQGDSTKEEPKYRCVVGGCGKQYHLPCLRLFPQHKFTGTTHKSSTLFCPNHTCHTCVSDDPRTNATSTKGHLIRCIKCPSSYHTEARCIPAGSQILSYAAMICPKHNLEQCSLNVNWCFLCCKGGSLICCETCPTAFHLECLKFDPPEGKYICEECESGRMPLYNEIVWAKYGVFRFWPAITIPPPLVPDNVEQLSHEKWDICVRFFGSYDYGWVNRRRMYLYQEGDSDTVEHKRTTIALRYSTALQDAKKVHGMLLAKRAAEQLTEGDEGSFKPPMYVKIKCNRYVAPLRAPYQAKEEMDSNVCECKATDDDPCGLDSNCINRALLMECNPKVCPAGERCQNQCFEKRQYPALVAKRILQKGWGLVAAEDIRLGQFVIEYVGEVINNEELARRLQHKVAQKDENYYFLTVDSELTIDAGPKGNLARFINHSCEPNCETMLWKVGGAQSVGLFAIKDIKAGEELTFNYNFESKGSDKKICHCNAAKCSGFIGQKYRPPLEEASGSGIGKRRKSDKKGKGAKRRKSTLDKRRKSTAVDKTASKEDTPGGSKRKRKSMPVVQDRIEDITIKNEPAESKDVGIEGSNSNADMAADNANTTAENTKSGEKAVEAEEEQQVKSESVE